MVIVLSKMDDNEVENKDSWCLIKMMVFNVNLINKVNKDNKVLRNYLILLKEIL